MKRRCALAESRCGELRHIFNSAAIPIELKLRIYQAAVGSLLTYGSEAWNLTEPTMAMINGCNARCLSHITRRSAHTEASPRTRTFDLVGAIRQRRYRWLGHILRMPSNRLVKEAIRVQHDMGLPGNIFMDTPPGVSFRELEMLAKNRKIWRARMPALEQHTYTTQQKPELEECDELSFLTQARPKPRPRPLTQLPLPWSLRSRPLNQQSTRTTPPTTPPKGDQHTAAIRYPQRDAHERFFRPLHHQKQKVQKSKPKEKKRSLTTKQRAAWAHAHYILHHGTATDAANFLENHNKVSNTSGPTISKLKQMRIIPLPAWEQANGILFSSSDESSSFSSPTRTQHCKAHLCLLQRLSPGQQRPISTPRFLSRQKSPTPTTTTTPSTTKLYTANHLHLDISNKIH